MYLGLGIISTHWDQDTQVLIYFSGNLQWRRPLGLRTAVFEALSLV